MGADDFLVSGKSYAELGMTMRPYDPGDFEIVRLTRDARLRALVGYLRARWWAEEWKGRGGHSDRDIAHVLIEAVSKSGKVHAQGLRVEMSWGVLQVRAKVSRRTLAKALARLEERGFLYRDNSRRKAGKSGAFVLREKVDQYGRRATTATTEVRGFDPRGLHLRAPLEGVPDVPRMRWPQPKFTPGRGTVAGTRKVRESKPPIPRDRIERLGKIRGAVVDALYAAGGSCTLPELCEVLHRSRPRDLRRRVLPMLEEAGIIEAANGVITLAADWSERLEAAREAGGEMDADEKAEGDRKRKSLAYRRRHKAPTSKPSNTGLAAVERSHEKRAEHIAAHYEHQARVRAAEREHRAFVKRFVHDRLRALGRIRLGLLQEILRDEGCTLSYAVPAALSLGCAVQRLPEYKNEEFVFAPREWGVEGVA